MVGEVHNMLHTQEGRGRISSHGRGGVQYAIGKRWGGKISRTFHGKQKMFFGAFQFPLLRKYILL